MRSLGSSLASVQEAGAEPPNEFLHAARYASGTALATTLPGSRRVIFWKPQRPTTHFAESLAMFTGGEFAISAPITYRDMKSGFDPGVLGQSNQQLPTVRFGRQVEEFARAHGIVGSLAIMDAILLEQRGWISSVNVEVSNDPEFDYTFLSFKLGTSSSVDEVLVRDARLQELILNLVPAEDQMHMAIVYEFC
jgi:hypothetical protein